MLKKNKGIENKNESFTKSKRGRNFAVVLYPQEDAKHAFLFDWLCRMCTIIWIEHDMDRYTSDVIDNGVVIHKQGELKKTHVHVLIMYDNPRTLDSVSKQFTDFYNCDLKPSEMLERFHVECVSSVSDYVKYMVHKTLQAQYENKYQYSPLLLHGNPSIISKALNTALDDKAIIHEIITYVKNRNLSYANLVQFVCSGEAPSYWYDYVIRKNPSIFRNICVDVKFDNRSC